MIRRRCVFSKFVWNVSKGMSPLIIHKSANDKFRKFSIIGGTEQVQTTGAQLWKPIEDKTVSGVEITTDKDGVIHLNGTSLDSANVMCGSIKTTATCTLSCVSTGIFPSNANVKVSAGVLSILNSNGASVSVTGLVVGDLRIRLEGGFTYNDCTLQIMLHEGSTALPYEPYTGGKPSPSLEYQQEIKNSGKWNEDARKYEVDVEVSSNLFDISKVQNGTGLINNGDGTLTLTTNVDGKAMLKEICPDLIVGETYALKFDTNGINYIYCNGVWSDKTSKQITQAMLDSVVYFYNNNHQPVVTIKNIQINRGAKVVPYSQYRIPQTITLTSDRPITKWDRLVEQGGQIGWLYGGKIIDSYNSELIDTEYMSSTGGLTVGATVLYKLKEPEFVPLPQSEQNAIRALKTYYPTTVITADGGEVQAGIEVEYAMK